MHVKLNTFNARLRRASGMQVIAVKIQFAQLRFQMTEIKPQIDRRPKKHVTADAAENIKIQDIHLPKFVNEFGRLLERSAVSVAELISLFVCHAE